MMRRSVSVLVLSLVAAVLVVAQPAPAVAAAGVCEDLAGASLAGGQLEGSTPVVLVHGFTGSNETWRVPIDQAIDDDVKVENRSFVDQLMRIDSVSVWLFEYHDTSARWVTDPRIGPALADLLECLADNGGKPSVLAVHSMGGLAARYALSLVDDSEIVSGLVTFGTPHLGSDVAAWMSGALDVVDVASMSTNPLLGSVWSFVRRDLDACAAARNVSVDDAECGWVGGIPPLGSEAGAALQRGSSAVVSLPPVPDHISVLGLGGQIDIVLQESVWGFFYSDVGRVSIGDTMVMVDSATAQSDETDVRTCQLNLKTGYAISDDFRELAEINYDDGKERGISALMSNPCQHSNLMHTVEITNQALGYINTIVESQGPYCPKGGNPTCIAGFEYGIEHIPDTGQTFAYSIVRYDSGEWVTVGEGFYDIDFDVPITVLQSLGADRSRSQALCTSFVSTHGLDADYFCHLRDAVPVSDATPLTIDGLGPIVLGMSLNDLNAATGQVFEIDIDMFFWNDGSCFFAWTPEVEGLGLAMDNWNVHRGSLVSIVQAIWIHDSGFTTDTGISVGTAETTLVERLGPELVVHQHEYVPDGSYYDYTVLSGSEEPITMRFTVEGGVVTAISLGYHSWATLTEACS